MEIDKFLSDPQSRRRFFKMSGVSVVGGSAVFLAACGDDDDNKQETGADTGGGEGDVAILNSALDLEFTAIAAYTAGASLLKGDALDAGKQFLGQEQEHADGLTQAIKQLGGTPNVKQDSYDFPELKSQVDVAKFAIDVENTAIAAYIDALPKLSSGELRGTAAAIVTNEAEHVAVLLGLLDKPQVPDAFVTGKAA